MPREDNVELSLSVAESETRVGSSVCAVPANRRAQEGEQGRGLQDSPAQQPGCLTMSYGTGRAPRGADTILQPNLPRQTHVKPSIGGKEGFKEINLACSLF